MIGRSDILIADDTAGNWKTKNLDLSGILRKPLAGNKGKLHFVSAEKKDFSNNIDDELIAKSLDAIENKRQINIFASIRNSNRAVGASLSAEVSERYGSEGLPENTVICIRGCPCRNF